MKTRLIEATNVNVGGMNWGKFALSRFTKEEWAVRSAVDEAGLLGGRGWTPEHLHVLDLATGEGFYLLPGGSVSHDMRKHNIWVCPLFEPFLEWLYKQDLRDLDLLPALVHIENPESSLAGYRRCGIHFAEEGDRQMTLLALAELSLSRPGFEHAIRQIAIEMGGEVMFDGFRQTSADRIKPVPLMTV